MKRCSHDPFVHTVGKARCVLPTIFCSSSMVRLLILLSFPQAPASALSHPPATLRTRSTKISLTFYKRPSTCVTSTTSTRRSPRPASHRRAARPTSSRHSKQPRSRLSDTPPRSSAPAAPSPKSGFHSTLADAPPRLTASSRSTRRTAWTLAQ